MTDENTPDLSSDERLAYLLVELNILSAAQIELALADQEINQIGLEEVILARGWITEEKLYNVAPWLKPGFLATDLKSAPLEPAAKEQEPRKAKVSSIQHPLQDWHAENAGKDASKPEDKPAADAPKKATAGPSVEVETVAQPVAKRKPGKTAHYEENLAAYNELKKKAFDAQ